MASLLNYNQIRHAAKDIKLRGPSNVYPAHKGGIKIYRIMSYLMIPVLGVLTAQCLFMGHHENERPDFVPYPHLRIRSKRFPWGEGQKSFFHNKEVNALPEGYED